uniref:Uncharacterized protein n=1 Tax=Anopheles farauti TaxID=69004 RepID=A0A182QIH6_9DIPT
MPASPAVGAATVPWLALRDGTGESQRASVGGGFGSLVRIEGEEGRWCLWSTRSRLATALPADRYEPKAYRERVEFLMIDIGSEAMLRRMSDTSLTPSSSIDTLVALSSKSYGPLSGSDSGSISIETGSSSDDFRGTVVVVRAPVRRFSNDSGLFVDRDSATDILDVRLTARDSLTGSSAPRVLSSSTQPPAASTFVVVTTTFPSASTSDERSPISTITSSTPSLMVEFSTPRFASGAFGRSYE